MAGGGSGGHVIPLLAVARELQQRGHNCTFIGTKTGFEARLVPPAGFRIEYIEIGGLKRVGLGRTIRTLAQLPVSSWRVLNLFHDLHPHGIFSLGGYAAGPVVLAGWWARIPIVIMEPNAMPGLTNRYMGRVAARALLNFPSAAQFFPRGRSEVTGLPVRDEFFRIEPKPWSPNPTVLITGGSQGSRTLNEAARQCWRMFREAKSGVVLIHQTGRNSYDELAREFAETGLQGEIVPFIDDVAAAFARADMVVCRAGAGATAELAAAGKPSILVPLPTAADNHQFHNAEAFQSAGAARLVPDNEMNGGRLYAEITKLAADRHLLGYMSSKARTFAHPNAARVAANSMEQAANVGSDA